MNFHLLLLLDNPFLLHFLLSSFRFVEFLLQRAFSFRFVEFLLQFAFLFSFVSLLLDLCAFHFFVRRLFAFISRNDGFPKSKDFFSELEPSSPTSKFSTSACVSRSVSISFASTSFAFFPSCLSHLACGILRSLDQVHAELEWRTLEHFHNNHRQARA